MKENIFEFENQETEAWIHIILDTNRFPFSGIPTYPGRLFLSHILSYHHILVDYFSLAYSHTIISWLIISLSHTLIFQACILEVPVPPMVPPVWCSIGLQWVKLLQCPEKFNPLSKLTLKQELKYIHTKDLDIKNLRYYWSLIEIE